MLGHTFVAIFFPGWIRGTDGPCNDPSFSRRRFMARKGQIRKARQDDVAFAPYTGVQRTFGKHTPSVVMVCHFT